MSQYSFNLDDDKECLTARKVLDVIQSQFKSSENIQSNASYRECQQCIELRKKTQDVDRQIDEYKSIIKSKDEEIESLRVKKDELLSLKEEKECQLQDQIMTLQKRLNAYEPSCAEADGEDQYYNISGGILIQTNSVDAPYIAKISSQGKASFHFNVEKGPCKQACDSKDEFILPFCEIVEEQPDANDIRLDKWGEATSNNSGELSVITKAKVKLVKL